MVTAYENIHAIQRTKKNLVCAKKYKNASLYNIGGTVKILGDTNPGILRQALLQLIQNNAALRLCFFEKDGQVYQYVSDHTYEIPFIDFTKEFDPTQAYKNWSQNSRKRLLQ